MASSPAPDPAASRAAPAPLTVAVSLVVVEAIGLLLQGLVLTPGMHGEHLVMNVTSAAFFLVFGAFLAYCAWQLYRLHSWARAPVVLAQMILMLVGGSFWGGATTAVAVLLIVVGVVTIAGIMHPDSLRALAQDD